jgi:hypothetical protein
MALFPQYTRDFNYKGRTFTNLVVSEGDAPAEKLIPAASENRNVKFKYAFGPTLSDTTNEQNVVIPKGKIVQPGDMEWDFETEYFVQTIKIAEAGSSTAIGVNHHNVYQRIRDRYAGNPATVITRNYIEVPYIDTTGLDETGQTKLLNSINYGVAYGAGKASVKAGDYLKVGEYGNFVKWDPAADKFEQIIGQAWAVETQLPPAGFLQYFLDMDGDAFSELIKNASYAPSPGTIYYGQGNQKVNSIGSMGDISKKVNLLPYKGIPFLTDGYFRAKTEVTGIQVSLLADGTSTDARVEYVRVNDSNSISLSNATAAGADPETQPAVPSTVTVTDYRRAMLTVKLKDQLAAIGDGTVSVKIGDTTYDAEANPNIVHVDYYNNTVVIYFNENIANKAITIDATMIVNPVAGIPTEWDFEKSMGAVRILIRR